MRLPRFHGKHAFAALLVLGAASVLLPVARADYAVLRSGQRLHVTSYEKTGETVQMQVAGGSISVAAAEIASIEPEDTFAVSERPKLAVPYAEQIQAAAITYGLDPQLIACVIAVESKFDARAVSRKAAYGLMQLLPQTASRMAVRDVFDPEQNINGGTRYLKELLQRYKQNLTLALAAYNAGPQTVDLYRGIPPFTETRNYVRQVMEKLKQYKSSGLEAATFSQ